MLRPASWFVSVVFLASSLAGVATAAPEKRVALVIGNAAYTSISRLEKPLNDSQKVAEVLRGIGFEVILGTNASKADLEALAEKFRTAVKGADVGFFYYSGHGFQTNRVEQQHPVNHIVPVDFKVREDATLATLALDVVIDALKREARVGFVFMDACRNDPQLAAASERMAASGTRAVTISRGFARVSVATDRPTATKQAARKGPAGLLIAYATDPGNVAFEGEKGPLSPFTGALVKHMATPGLTVGEMMGRVSVDVSSETQGLQTPWNVSSLTAGTYQFLPRAAQPAGAPSGRQSTRPAAAKKSVGGGAPARNNLPPNLGGGVGAGL